MTTPQQVLSDERVAEVLTTSYGSPEWTMDDVRAARAIESSTLKAVSVQEPVHQFRKQHCADWYDGHPDHEDGGGPYETRTLYPLPPAHQPTKGGEA